MKAYVDTSAFVKLFVREQESVALDRYLAESRAAVRLCSSNLLETEARRAATLSGVDQTRVTEELELIDLLDTSRGLFTAAGLIRPPSLRSLDAIHLATAMREGVDVLIAYDHRLLDAARSAGIPTASPA